jgi:hypothetical protein
VSGEEEYLNRKGMARRKPKNRFRIDMDKGFYFTLICGNNNAACRD